MKISSLNMLTILVTFMALLPGLAAAQSAADVGVNQPTSQELISGATLDNATAQLNISEIGNTTDVKRLADVSQVFTTNPGEAMNISAVNFAGDRWAQITNEGIVERNISGFMLINSQNLTYTIPAVVLPVGGSVRVHQGPGQSTASDIYMNSQTPFFSDPNGAIILTDNTGSIITRYVPASSSGAPLTPTPSFSPVLITPAGATSTTASNETTFEDVVNQSIGLTSVDETSFEELATSDESVPVASGGALSSETGALSPVTAEQNAAAMNSIVNNIGAA